MSDQLNSDQFNSDQFTEVTSAGWLQRLGGSLVAAIFGIILLPISIGLLYWNEGRAVDAIVALNRGAASVVEADAAAVNPQFDGKLVHLSGLMEPTTPASDPVFGISANGLLRLSRNVEMYQWKEESSSHSQTSVGGTKTTETTYTYQRVWSDQPISSSSFKQAANHQNPAMPIRSESFNGDGVKLGAYRVDPSVLNKVTAFAALPVRSAPPAGYQASGDGFYRGRDPSQPAIGDLRVTFKAVAAQTISVAAAQAGGALTAYHDKNGYTIALAEPGMVAASVLFRDEQRSENILTWILRAVGFVVMFIGFICLTRPLTMLVAVLPPLESLLDAGAFIVALTLAVPITLLTIAIAWIMHRPLIGGLLLAAAVAAIFLLRQLRRRPA